MLKMGTRFVSFFAIYAVCLGALIYVKMMSKMLLWLGTYKTGRSRGTFSSPITLTLVPVKKMSTLKACVIIHWEDTARALLEKSPTISSIRMKGMDAKRKITVHPIAVIKRNIFHLWVASAWIGIVKYFG